MDLCFVSPLRCAMKAWSHLLCSGARCARLCSLMSHQCKGDESEQVGVRDHCRVSFVPCLPPPHPLLLTESLSPSLLEPLISELSLLSLPPSPSLSHTHTHTHTGRNNLGAIWMLVVLQGEPGRERLLMSALTKPRSRPWIANSSLHWPQTLAASDKTWRIACIIAKKLLQCITPTHTDARTHAHTHTHTNPHWYQHMYTQSPSRFAVMRFVLYQKRYCNAGFVYALISNQMQWLKSTVRKQSSRVDVGYGQNS